METQKGKQYGNNERKGVKDEGEGRQRERKTGRYK
jgi:hypothetical protein